MKDFTTGNIPKTMFKFLIPLLLGNMLQAVYMLIDAIWAGRLLGPAGVAVVATGMPVAFLLSSVVIGIIVGASILAGHAFGAKNRAALTDIVSTSMIGTAGISLAISVAGVIFCGPLLRLINTPASLQHGAHIFLSLIIASMPLSSMGQWFGAMMNAAGDSKTPFRIMFVSLIVNAVLAPVLITGAGIFPPLGITGSALSTIIANIVAAILCVSAWKSHHLAEIAPIKFEVHWHTLRTIIKIGFPMALQMLITSSSFLFVLALANKFGPNVTAAFGIGGRIDQLSFMATFAVAAAASAMTAQNYGAGRLDRIPQIANWALIYALGLAAVFSVSVVAFPNAVTSMFTNDPAILPLTRHYFYVTAFSYLMLGVLSAYLGILRGTGDTITSFIIVAASMIFLRVPLCYYLSNYTGLRETGLWIGITVSSSAGALAFYLYYASGKWKTRGTRLQKPPEEPVIAEAFPAQEPGAAE